MNGELCLRTKVFVFSFRLDEQCVSACIQIGVSNGMQPSRVLVHSLEKPSSL